MCSTVLQDTVVHAIRSQDVAVSGAASTTGSTDSGVHSTGLLALDTDGAGEEDW